MNTHTNKNPSAAHNIFYDGYREPELPLSDETSPQPSSPCFSVHSNSAEAE